MRRPIIAGNWKMFKKPDEAISLAQELKELLNHQQAEVVVCPPFVDLPGVGEVLKKSKIALGAQNMHWEGEGAFTGEISPIMLKSLGCTYVIVGHSERRQYFQENNEMINKKVKAALNHDLKPILCVGETMAEREKGITEALIETQIKIALQGVSKAEAENLVIAYEPIWAIGTGKTSSPEDAEKVISHIRQILKSLFGDEIAGLIRIQYGGSVKPDNIKNLMAQANIDGALVGGASLKADSFQQIVNFDA